MVKAIHVYRCLLDVTASVSNSIKSLGGELFLLAACVALRWIR